MHFKDVEFLNLKHFNEKAHIKYLKSSIYFFHKILIEIKLFKAHSNDVIHAVWCI